MASSTMTNRQALEIGIKAIGDSNPEAAAKLSNIVAQMDARNAKRAEKPSKTALANAPLKESILSYLTDHTGEYTCMDLGAALSMTHSMRWWRAMTM